MIYIYQFGHWAGLLLPALAPSATLLGATAGESADAVLTQVRSDCTLFAFHIDLTDASQVPLQRDRLAAALADRRVTLLNRDTTDISKRRIQRACLAAGLPCATAPRDGDPDEWLVVKTDLNCGGDPERRLSDADRARLGIRLSDEWTGSHSYRRARRAEIAPSIWDSPDLVVERWIANREDLFFRVYVMRSHVVMCRGKDTALFKQMRGAIPRTAWFIDADRAAVLQGPLPAPMHVFDTVARFRSAFPLDFGAIDLMLDDEGTGYVIDVNPTPYWGGGSHPVLAPVMTFLASGLQPDCH